MQKILTLGWLVLVGCLPAGCQSWKSVIPPQAQVSHVRIKSHSPQGCTVLVQVHITNDNAFALPLINNHYKVTLANQYQFHYEEDPRRTLPAKGTQTLTFEASFPITDLGPLGTACTIKGYAQYRAPGKLRVVFYDSGVPLPSIHYALTCKLDAPVAHAPATSVPTLASD